MENHRCAHKSVELSERNVGNELVNKPSSGILVSNNVELAVSQNELIKRFLEIDTGGGNWG
ncbi:hypothetical protein EJB05_00941 [Eragrostis curvula]|uniref:Uncharacterized protein n=1 Tax=Eragrostis curvula TaxID=38414 RepID=A0A5J9WND8_9POAL|nr:hypothetical protein EJB05_00941 [Eragrostis curvula]